MYVWSCMCMPLKWEVREGWLVPCSGVLIVVVALDYWFFDCPFILPILSFDFFPLPFSSHLSLPSCITEHRKPSLEELRRGAQKGRRSRRQHFFYLLSPPCR
jgi:hypothetical protein